MRPSHWFVLILFLSSVSVMGAGQSVEAVDDSGTTIRLAAPARRIISLAPHTTELLFAAGAGDKVVGAVSYSDYPEAAKQITRVGNYKRLDIEAILALRPDLIIAWHDGNASEDLTRLKNLGLTVYETEPRHLEDIPRHIQRLGRLAGTEQVAIEAASRLQQRLEKLQQDYADREKVTVFYQIWRKPLMTINGEHIISEVMSLCGGSNVFAQESQLAPRIGIEAVLQANPAVIIASGMGESRPEWLDEWMAWPQLQAAEAKNLYFIEPAILQRHGPRIFTGAEQLCRILDEARLKLANQR